MWDYTVSLILLAYLIRYIRDCERSDDNAFGIPVPFHNYHCYAIVNSLTLSVKSIFIFKIWSSQRLLSDVNSMEINPIPGIHIKMSISDILFLEVHCDVTSTRYIDGKHRLVVGSDLRLRSNQILHVKLVISFVPIRKLVSAPAEIAAAIVSDLDPQLVPPLPR